LTKDSSIVKTLEVTILNPLVITNEETICFLNETLTLVVDDLRATNHLETLTWSSSNEEVATVTDGVVTGVSNGQATISVENAEGLVATKEITVMYETITIIAINDLEGDVEIFEEVQLTASVTPTNANQSVTWSTDDEAIATIDENGLLTTHNVGTVIITATSVANPELQATMTIEVKIDPIAMMASVHDESPINQTVTTYGASERQQVVYGSVSNYFFAPLNQVEQIAPMTMIGGTGTSNTYVGQTATPTLLTTVEPLKFTRSGILHPATTYITYHDTGNNTPGADGFMHATYLSGSANLNDRARSWHYTVDDVAAVHHIPDNEVTWQGDNYTSYAYSIGIETAVDFGSDLYATWHRTAKLIAKLMMEYDIPFENIIQHYAWSGKNCPQTLVVITYIQKPWKWCWLNTWLLNTYLSIHHYDFSKS
jgi:N-acetylmuramoyl-L-alanine amidase